MFPRASAKLTHDNVLQWLYLDAGIFNFVERYMVSFDADGIHFTRGVLFLYVSYFFFVGFMYSYLMEPELIPHRLFYLDRIMRCYLMALTAVCVTLLLECVCVLFMNSHLALCCVYRLFILS